MTGPTFCADAELEEKIYQEETEIDAATIQKNYEDQVVSKLDVQGKMALKLYIDALKAGTIKGDE